MQSETSPFSATGQLVGYLYQCRYALYESLSKLYNVVKADFVLSIETLDDVVFEKLGEPWDILQTKHHLENKSNLSDSSVDLWKTLRVWCESLEKNLIPENAYHYLITTEQAVTDSAVTYLKADSKRDIDKALQKLDSTSLTSKNKTIKPCFDAYRNLSVEQRKSILNSTFVIDSSPSIQDLDELLIKQANMFIGRKYAEYFLEKIEGWWYRRCIKSLTKNSQEWISSKELEAELDYTRDQFQSQSLTIDDDILQQTVNAADFEDYIFVQQLKLIDISLKRIYFAIRDYYRAFNQRSKWLREDLIFVGELERYETQLKELWELQFERMCQELGEELAEIEKCKAAQKLYSWAEDQIVHIRPNSTLDRFITLGSFHMLANDKHIGWHPKFLERLALILGLEESSVS